MVIRTAKQVSSLDDVTIATDSQDVIELAKEYGLTIYDATYLYEVKKYKSRLISLDKKLVEAYGRFVVKDELL